ncbi:MAG: hypothetical protein ABH983_00030 [Candidatus Micrarchaeota archaeon]
MFFRSKKKPGQSAKDPRAAILESKRAIGASLREKTVVFIVEDTQFAILTPLIQSGVFRGIVSSKSRVLTYTGFFSDNLSADVLVLKPSSRIGENLALFTDRLIDFKSSNPNSAVIVCATDPELSKRLIPHYQAGQIDSLEKSGSDDFQILFNASKILERLQR